MIRYRPRLFPRHADGVAPLVLGLRRVYILPSTFGLSYVLALLIMLVGAINYSLALGHALVFFLVGLGLAGMVQTVRNLLGIRLQAGQPAPVFAGTLARFPLYLDSSSQHPALQACMIAPRRQRRDLPRVQADLFPGVPACLALPVPAIRRGWLVLPGVHLYTRFPLGLFTAWSHWRPDVRCLVYPQPLSLPDCPLPAPGDGRETALSAPPDHPGRAGQEDFSGLRPHHPADSPRHIAWKAAARNPDSPLLVKQFSAAMLPQCWLDWALLPATLDVEQRLSLLTGWVLAAAAAGEAYGLRLPGNEIAPAQGETHRLHCLQVLALFGLGDS